MQKTWRQNKMKFETLVTFLEEESLRDWFKHTHRDPKTGKTFHGWVDCKTGKPCGRQKGEKRRGYPACRPTKAQCSSAKYKKKGHKRISWKKK